MMLTAEKLFLFSINLETRQLYDRAKTNLRRALSAAIIIDLAHKRLIDFSVGKVIPNNIFYDGDAILEDSLGLIKQQKKDRTIEYWITNLDNKLSLFNRIQYQLHAKGIIKIVVNDGLLLKKTTYQIQEPSTIHNLMQRFKKGILEKTFSANDLLLLQLVQTCRLDEMIFSKSERKLIKDCKVTTELDPKKYVIEDFDASSVIISLVISTVLVDQGLIGLSE